MIGVAHVLSMVALAGALHGPAAPVEPAGPDGLTGPAWAELTLSIHQGQSASGTNLGTVTLTCHPSGGTHPEAATACAALDRAGGQVGRLPGSNGICPMIYQPATAVATGHWGFTPQKFVQTYTNLCDLRNSLSPVYDF